MDFGEDFTRAIMAAIGQKEFASFKKKLKETYDEKKDPTDNPCEAENSYSKCTISNAKDEDVVKKTEGVIARIYTQDLYNKHEDRFLMFPSTLSNLHTIEICNPTHRFTCDVIVPPDKNIYQALQRLGQNTICYIVQIQKFMVFGGSYMPKGKNTKDDDLHLKKDVDEHKVKIPLLPNASDLFYVTYNTTDYAYPTKLMYFAHYGYKEQYEKFKTLGKNHFKVPFFDLDGKLIKIGKTLQILNEKEKEIYETKDKTQPNYHTQMVMQYVCGGFNSNAKLKMIILRVNYQGKEKDLQKEYDAHIKDKKNMVQFKIVMFDPEKQLIIFQREKTKKTEK